MKTNEIDDLRKKMRTKTTIEISNAAMEVLEQIAGKKTKDPMILLHTCSGSDVGNFVEGLIYKYDLEYEEYDDWGEYADDDYEEDYEDDDWEVIDGD